MSEKEMLNVIDNAAFVVNGYAFIKKDDSRIEIVSLDQPNHVMIINTSGEMLETNMDSIEQAIVIDLGAKNLQFMEG